ncbi:DUF397 domain-containing protein [Actinacidiphila glaucinigra]|uniref:DUF397 domain-containing protein n=1 Tax=Actinacidiphila glaucinigra TaxID=235986 RepID=UPI00367319DB
MHMRTIGATLKGEVHPMATGDPMTGAGKAELYAMDLTDADWVASSHSNRWDKTCVEVADLGGGAVALRDSQNKEMPPLRFTAEEWTAFRLGVRDGEFG